MSAPKPPNFGQMVNAWDQPETFAALVRDYYAMVAAQRTGELRDITEPLHPKESA